MRSRGTRRPTHRDNDAAVVVLDTGALIAAERGNEKWRALMRRLAKRNVELVVPAGALAQAWRGTPTQALLARFLADKRIRHAPLDQIGAKAVGVLLGRSDTDDVVDASIVVCARRLRAAMVLTSDPDDLRALDPGLQLETI